MGKIVLDLGSHPLCDDLVPIGSEVVTEEFHQLIGLCEVCLTAHQKVPVVKEKLFKSDYHYRAALTVDVIQGMNDLAEQVINDLDSKSKTVTVLDIGCNDGSLLGIFKNKYKCTTIGVDPTEAILESGNKIEYKFNEYFSRSTAEEIKKLPHVVDVITFTNVFAHIENLPELIENLKLLMNDSTKLVIENHYLGSILSKNQFDTFYHEHPRTYSLKSFEFIAKTIGLIITDVKFPSRYGGNIRVTMEKNGNEANLQLFNQLEFDFISRFELLQDRYNKWRNESQDILSSLLEDGPVYGKALPGRAVMLINSLKIDSRMMPAVFEKPNSPKINNFVPGSKIRILSDSEILKVNPKRMIIWSWHIIDEIAEYLDKLGYQGEIWVPLPEFKKYR
jgi:SAM-dependent methyltransferase